MGSSEATTTRAMPASTIASVHGGVRPTWQQGSSETYSVEPAGSSVAAASASRSACVLTGSAVKALADHPPVLHEQRAHERIRARLAARLLGELDRSVQVELVVGGGGVGHV